MNIDLTSLSAGQVYFHMLQTLIPRPVAWVLSENKSGSYNLAPFSYFNAISSDPPMIMLSIGKKSDGTHKDTRVNIETRHDFVIHIAHTQMLEALNQSSEELAANVSELEKLELETTGFEGSRLPRIKSCRIAYACRFHGIHEIGNTPQSVVYAEVNQIYVDDTIITVKDDKRIVVDADKLEPISRLGANQYMKFGEVIPLKRPI